MKTWYICPSCKKEVCVETKKRKNEKYIKAYCKECKTELEEITNHVQFDFISVTEDR